MSFPQYTEHASGRTVDRYPADLYTGETGEVSARLRPADTAHDLVYPSGGSADYLATGVTTRGEFGLYRWNMPAGPGGPIWSRASVRTSGHRRMTPQSPTKSSRCPTPTRSR